MKRIQFCLMVFALSLIASGIAQAQATRTWVSGVGDDANPCSRTAPCKTFAGAISKTATGGEIDALDPGGFGAITITKSITIDGGTGNIAGVLVAGTDGIDVNGSGIVVTLRNLDIDGLVGNGINSGLNGIKFVTGSVLHVEHCVIYGFQNNGIDIGTSAAAQVSIVDSILRDNLQNGLLVQNTLANAQVLVSGSHFDDNTENGIWSSDFSRVTVRDSEASGNTLAGFLAQASNGSATMNVINSTAANNAGAGIQAGGGTATSSIRTTGNSVFTNTSGFVVASNGTITSFENNYNAGSGAPSGTMSPQ